MIKFNLDVPNGCKDCKFKVLIGGYCIVNRDIYAAGVKEGRHKNCPIIDCED